ncbi:MAG: ATP-binding protein [Bacteroidota bacterium]|nr:ATP-binding protein [Bacteroidota bacterium]
MTLLGGITYEQTEKFMGSFIRYEEPRQLFYDNLVGNTIKVETDKDVAVLIFENREKKFNYLSCDTDFYKYLAEPSEEPALNRPVDFLESIVILHLKTQDKEKISRVQYLFKEFDNSASFEFDGRELANNVLRNPSLRYPPKSYTFNKNTLVNLDYIEEFLCPPTGNNLFEIIQTNSKLRQEIASMFERYGQKLQLRMDERRLEIIKDQDGIIYSYPYSSVADTLQRIIFYLAAIESNDDAVLLFEAPEAHSFPVYVSKLGRRIVESRNNQFFIDTHSPYLITEVLETILTDDAQAGELAMFAAYYEDHQTKVHQLSDEEIRSIRNDGIDVFYNMKRFTTGAASNA